MLLKTREQKRFYDWRFSFWNAFSAVSLISNLDIYRKLETMRLVKIKKLVVAAILLLVFATMFCGVMTASVSADENYNDYSQEHSDGPGEAPDEGMLRDEPRTRFKDY